MDGLKLHISKNIRMKILYRLKTKIFFIATKIKKDLYFRKLQMYLSLSRNTDFRNTLHKLNLVTCMIWHDLDNYRQIHINDVEFDKYASLLPSYSQIIHIELTRLKFDLFNLISSLSLFI